MRIHYLTCCSAIFLLTATMALTACSSLATIECEEAESFGLKQRLHDEASGGIRMVDFREEGDYLLFKKTPRGKFLAITYSLSANGPMQCSIYVAGKDVATAFFEPTGGWGFYRQAIVRVDTGGELRIQIDADDLKANGGGPMASQDKIEILARAPEVSSVYGELRERMAEVLTLRYAPDPDVTGTEDWSKQLGKDGRWTDIDYGRRAFPIEHLKRAREMAAAARNGDAKREDIARALDAWIAGEFDGHEWWQTQIDVPNVMAEILVLLGDDAPHATRSRCLEVAGQAWPAPEDGRGWGHNALRRARVALMLGVVTGSKSLVREAVQTVSNNIRQCLHDGIQADWSFIQFGVPATGGAGLEFLEDATELGVMLAESDFALSAYKLGVLSDFVLEAQQNVARGVAFDPSVLAADIAGPSAGRRADRLVAICERLLWLKAPRAKELDAMKKRIVLSARVGSRPDTKWDYESSRYFWRAGLLAHQTKTFLASMRMASSRVGGTESVGRRNMRGYHLPDGAVWFMRRGDEYAGLFPIFDWRRIPGVTCEGGSGPLPVPERGSDDCGSRTNFAGGASDGRVAASGFHLERAGVTARKAAFFFDGEVVCLGAGIRSKTEAPIVTTLNQCAVRGPFDVHAPPTHKRIQRGGSIWDKAQWFHHDRIGYAIFGEQRTEVHSERRVGNSRDIDRSRPGQRVARDVFTLWIDHGQRPKSASYAYAIVADIHIDDMPAYFSTPPFQIVSNTEKLQAVAHPELQAVAAVFHEAGSLKTAAGLEIWVDAPCVLVYREDEDRPVLALSSPLGDSPTMHVTINRPLMGNGATLDEKSGRTVVAANLPGGAHAGATWIRDFAR